MCLIDFTSIVGLSTLLKLNYDWPGLNPHDPSLIKIDPFENTTFIFLVILDYCSIVAIRQKFP